MSADRYSEVQDFLERVGWGGAARFPIEGDASTRRYVRLKMGSRSAILMDQPQQAETASATAFATTQERRALGYNAVARLAGADCARFAAVADYLRRLGISAPEILALDARLGFGLLEDLGDHLFASVVSSGSEQELYAAAADVLVRLHAEAAPSLLPPDKVLHAYDEVALLAEIDLLTEWFFPLALGHEARPDDVEEHRTLWRRTLASTLGTSSVFVHRDFHAQNLIWLPSRQGLERVGVIDFQDAVAGSPAYDLASLLEDARRDVPPEIAEATVGHYLDSMRRQGTSVDGNQFREQLAIAAAQRNAKIVGIFSRLSQRDGKSRYLEYLPRVWGYLNCDLENPALRDLKRWYDRSIPVHARGSSRR